MKKPKTICQQHAPNLETLKRAFRDNAVALLECKVKSTGEVVAAIVAVSSENGEALFTPFAVMLNGNPFELLCPPNPEGGFAP